MAGYDAELRLNWSDDDPIHVEIDLTDERIVMRAGEVAVADWSLEDVVISPQVDGFHIRAEGEEVVLNVTEDAQFAVDLGLRNAPPALRRRMGALKSAGTSR